MRITKVDANSSVDVSRRTVAQAAGVDALAIHAGVVERDNPFESMLTRSKTPPDED